MTNRSLFLLSAACAASWMIAASTLEAQRPAEALSEPEYRELRQLSRTLDERAGQANDRAQRRESWIARRDRSLLDSIADFERSARRLDELMANYRSAPFQVDEDLGRLLRSAEELQDRVRRSRFADDNTLSDWNEIVEILKRMTRVNRSGAGVIEFAPGPGRDEYGERHGPPPSRDFGEVAGLARELEDRAARAHGLAQRVANQGPYRREFFQSIRDFHDQTVAFRRSLDEFGDRGQVRAEAARLLDFARRTDQRMRRSRAFREVWQEWQGAIQVLQRIVSLVGG